MNSDGYKLLFCLGRLPRSFLISGNAVAALAGHYLKKLLRFAYFPRGRRHPVSFLAKSKTKNWRQWGLLKTGPSPQHSYFCNLLCWPCHLSILDRLKWIV
jgi:hypothetical protein